MTRRLLTGKWLNDTVPKLGWSCTGMVDLRVREPQASNEICQMCEARHIRYVHILSHDLWPEPMRVGRTCAERMEGNRDEVARRERQSRKEARRLERWVRAGWVTTSKADGVMVTHRDCGDWRIEVARFGAHCILHLRHTPTGKVIVKREAENLILAKYDAWALWHEGEALRADYLARVAAEAREQRLAAEATRREEEAAQRAAWRRAHPDWEANQRAWDDYLEHREKNTQRRRLSRSMALLAVPDGPDQWQAAIRGQDGDVTHLSGVYPTGQAALADAEDVLKKELARRHGHDRAGAIMALGTQKPRSLRESLRQHPSRVALGE